MDSEATRQETFRNVLLCVKNEATTVITKMRQNAKWALTPGSRLNSEMSQGAQELMQGLLALRFGGVLTESTPPMVYIDPFLRIIVDVEASGPITAVALTSVKRLFNANVLGSLPFPGLAEAMHLTISALTYCKFEATHDSYDEMVLCNILQTLCACLECPTGHYLSDEDVCSMFEAAYRIGFDPLIVPDPSEMVIDLVKGTLHSIVCLVFSSLRNPRPAPPDTTPTPPSPTSMDPLPTSTTPVHPTSDGLVQGGTAGAEYDAAHADAPEAASAPGFGVGCAVYILQFLISLIPLEAMCKFSLDLIRDAVQSTGPVLQEHPTLMHAIQVDLLGGIFDVFKQKPSVTEPLKISSAVITHMTQLLLTVYQNLRKVCLLQVEVYVQTILLPIASGTLLHSSKGHTPSSTVEVAIESLLDFCHLPGFLREAYAHLDCRTEATNLFHDICRVLARIAQPRGSGPHPTLTAVNTTALLGLMAVQTVLLEGGNKPVSVVVPPECLFTNKKRLDLWGAIIRGEEPDCQTLMEELRDGPRVAMDDDDDSDSVWEALCSIRKLQWEKSIKTKVNECIDILNDDYKKGLQSLQVNRLLPDPMDPLTVAGFLRYARGVDRQLIGNFMGKNDPFNKEVLAAYVRTFAHTVLSFDSAFRAFADTFKQPPESQQVIRFTHAFVTAFLEANDNDYRGFRTFKCLDDFMTVSLWHNSTWYNTNPKVPKMRSLPDFVHAMSDSITKDDDPDHEVFREMYESICTTAFPQGSNTQWVVDMPRVRLVVIADRTTTPRGQVPPPSPFITALDRDMFLSMWSLTVRATASIMEHAPPDDTAVIVDGMRCLRLTAQIAKDNHVEDVIDSLLRTLTKFTSCLYPSSQYPGNIVTFGTSRLAQEAVLTLFAIVSEYGDLLRGGWTQVIACILRLHKLHLVDSSLFVDDRSAQDGGTKLHRVQRAAAESSNNLLSYLFSSGPSQDDHLSPAEHAAEATARQCIVECRLESIFEDSKFLGPEALLELIRAVIDVPGSMDPMSEDPLDIDAAEACLELLIKLCIRNRDRIQFLLPPVHAHLLCIVENTTDATVGLTMRAVSGLIRVCTRLLAYRHDVSKVLLDSLMILTSLDLSRDAEPSLYDAAPVIAKGLRTLVGSCAEHIHSPAGWLVICQLMRRSLVHPDALGPCYTALESLCHEGAHITTANYAHIVTAISDFVKTGSSMRHPMHNLEGSSQAPVELKPLTSALDLLEGVIQWLVGWRQSVVTQTRPESDVHTKESISDEDYATLDACWSHVLNAVVTNCNDWSPEVRDHAMIVLHKSLVTAGESLHLTPESWGSTWKEHVLPMVQSLASSAIEQDGLVDGADASRWMSQSLSMAINTVSKMFLAHMNDLMELQEWRALWLATLQVLGQCDLNATSDLHQVVVGAMTSLLTAMHSHGLLTKQEGDSDSHLWDRSWAIASKVSEQLNPSALNCDKPRPKPNTGPPATSL